LKTPKKQVSHFFTLQARKVRHAEEREVYFSFLTPKLSGGFSRPLKGIVRNL